MMLRPRQSLLVQRTLEALALHGNTLAVAPTGCHAPGTLILMFDGGLKPVEDVVVGDNLMGPDSTSRTVLELHRGHEKMYEIEPIKGLTFAVNAGHVLSLVRTNEGGGPGNKSVLADSIVDIELSTYLTQSDNFRHLHKLFRVAVDFPLRHAPTVDPYFLGVLIGDGCLKYDVNVTTPDVEIVEVIQRQALVYGLQVRTEQIFNNQANTYHLVGRRGVTNPLTRALRALQIFGLGSGDKFIPDDFKLGSRSTREQVLAGLLDTDGYLGHGCYEFSSKSLRLANDAAFVARSLGFAAYISRKVVGGLDYWRVGISGPCERLPLRVVRKQSRERRQKKNVLRTGFTVRPIGPGDYYGFSIDGDHRYVMGDFTVTHNSGKTIMLSAVVGNMLSEPDAKACVLAHRTELTGQNRAKFARVNPRLSTSVFDAQEKSWAGNATFAMVQTLSRPMNLAQMPTLDLLVIDEAHHASSPSYRVVIDQVLAKNPNRGDGKALREVFSNVADQISLGEMIASGHLVPPRTFVIDVGAQEALQNVRRTAIDFDMEQVATILNKSLITDAVIAHWKQKALERKTIVFCSTVAHAKSVCEAFVAAGVPSVLIHGELSPVERQTRLQAFESGSAQVVVNVAVLTEGYDYTPTACVVLLRPSSYKSTFIQMVGRGLRTVDPQEFPGVIKSDCVVLDFGTASLMHGALEQEVNLDGHAHEGEAPTKECPQCEAIVPLSCMECPLCGHVWERQPEDTGALSDFIMSEIDLLKRSNFRWCDLFGCDDALMATGFTAWGGVFFLNGRWHAIGGAKSMRPTLLAVGERAVCMARADDWLNDHESADSAHKTRRWLNESPTAKQLVYLPEAMRLDFGMTRYQASALLSFQFNRKEIQRLVTAANDAHHSSQTNHSHVLEAA
jgi:superfamily II DNA or RNA helicase